MTCWGYEVGAGKGAGQSRRKGMMGTISKVPLGDCASLRVPLEPGVSLCSNLCLAVSQVPIDHSDLVADLLKELSNHNERVEERKGALLELLKITREDSLGVWEEHFKTILLLLLETLGDKDVRSSLCSVSPSSWGAQALALLCIVLTVYIKHVSNVFQAPNSKVMFCQKHPSLYAGFVCSWLCNWWGELVPASGYFNTKFFKTSLA